MNNSKVTKKGRKSVLAILARRDVLRDSDLKRLDPRREAAKRRAQREKREALERIGNEEALSKLEDRIAQELASLEAGRAEKERKRLEELAEFAVEHAERIARIQEDEVRIAELRRSARYDEMRENARRNGGVDKDQMRRLLEEHDAKLRARGLDPEWIGADEAKPKRWDLLGRPL